MQYPERPPINFKWVGHLSLKYDLKIRGHFVLAPKHLDSQIRYVKHIFKDLFLKEDFEKTP